MTLQIRGIVEELHETKNYPKKDGSGTLNITKLKIAGKYYTSFDDSQLKGIQVGSDVDVDFTQKENNFEGKKYINNNISVIKLHDEELSQQTQDKIDAVAKSMGQPAQPIAKLKGENTINLGSKTFKVTLEEI